MTEDGVETARIKVEAMAIEGTAAKDPRGFSAALDELVAKVREIGYEHGVTYATEARDEGVEEELLASLAESYGERYECR